MSIATEITRIKTAKADIKSAIEEKGVEVGNGTIDTYAEKVREISGGGVIDLGRYAKSIQMATDEGLPEDMVFDLLYVQSLNSFVGSPTYPFNSIKHLTINCPNQITSMNRVFYGSVAYPLGFEHITLNFDTSKCTSYRQSFNRLPNLKIIDGYPLDFSIEIDNTQMFSSCDLLEEVRVVKETIKRSISVNLPSASAETVQSFVDGLADLTGGTQQTLTLHSTVGAKLTEEQKATITAKNWTLAY